ncbi:hypothetical protein [Congregibacter litoralis]|uniref:Uncharacterized protein n=1 Tax=Congregibacter litoralis KT71 TaxID=314285 RepID=A4A4K6_9GAMM|nr:hypothetical protein [Congregibacter litoralis]EAQ98727.1 hypothetical protein KT71_08877 [Congregibacter litoralis KT71]
MNSYKRVIAILVAGLLCNHAPAAGVFSNCFVPDIVKAFGLKRFPGPDELSVIGYGLVESIPQSGQTERPPMLRFSVLANRRVLGSSEVIFFRSDVSACLSRANLSRPVAKTKGRRFILEHQVGEVCPSGNALMDATIVEINPCKAECEPRSRSSVIFLGPEAVEGVTILDMPYFGGEIHLRDVSMIWQKSPSLPKVMHGYTR